MLKLLVVLFITFLLSIRANFYGNLSRNKSYTLWFKTFFFKEIPLLMLTNQSKVLFIILINQNKVLCIKIKKRSENSHESVF